jgi:hypothetical protein
VFKNILDKIAENPHSDITSLFSPLANLRH